MKQRPRADSIFLSCVRADFGRVRRLCRRLRQAGFNPKMEGDDVLPGEPRETAVRRGIANSFALVICLSSSSTTSRGSLGGEILSVIGIWRDCPDCGVPLVLARLDESPLPSAFAGLRSSDCFRKDGGKGLCQILGEYTPKATGGKAPSSRASRRRTAVRGPTSNATGRAIEYSRAMCLLAETRSREGVLGDLTRTLDDPDWDCHLLASFFSALFESSGAVVYVQEEAGRWRLSSSSGISGTGLQNPRRAIDGLCPAEIGKTGTLALRDYGRGQAKTDGRVLPRYVAWIPVVRDGKLLALAAIFRNERKGPFRTTHLSDWRRFATRLADEIHARGIQGAALPPHFSGDDAETLAKALTDMGFLDSEAELPAPFRTASGVAGKSRVYFLFLPTEEGGISLVAKFDEPARAKREWDAIKALSKINTCPQAMLPCRLNRRDHGVVIYQDASGQTASGQVVELQELLEHQLTTNSANCVLGLTQALSALSLFYHGTMRAHARGRVLQWRDAFPDLVEGARRTAIMGVKDRHWEYVSTMWQGEILDPLQSLATLDNTLNNPVGTTMFSHVHGDLNLHNILFGLNGQAIPVDTFIIDLANFQPEAVTATDFARMETEFWHESFSHQGTDDRVMLRAMKRIRDCLDGRLVRLRPNPSSFETSALRFVHCLRTSARDILSAGRPDYLFRDFAVVTFLSHINALGFASVQKSERAVRAALLGASLALRYLNDLAAGRYAKRSRSKLRRPLRPLPDLLPT